MARRPFLVLGLTLAAALSSACAGSGASAKDGAREERAPAEALASTASTAPASEFDSMDPDAFRATMRRAAAASKEDRARAAGIYTETLARTDLTNDQRATAQMCFGHLRLSEGKLDEARTLGQQALANRPGWDDAEQLLQQVDARAAKRKGATASDDGAAKAARKKMKEADPAAAKAGKRAEKRAEKKGAAAGALTGPKGGPEAAALRKRSEALAAEMHQVEIERDLLRSRVHELEAKLAELKKSQQ